MLTIRENFIETVKGGKPDRFVKQFEYMELVSDPILDNCSDDCPRGGQVTNLWGATFCWPASAPGPMPLHDAEHLLLKDITRWRDIIHAPDPGSFPEESWAPYVARANAVDRREKFVAPIIGNGIFEKLHTFMGMENTMVNFYAEPEAMHDLIDYITDWELACIPVQAAHYHPDAVFHHDDWGSQTRLFLSPDMFEEFIFPAYQKIYKCWKDNGAAYIIHHSDSYAAELVPFMIEMGVDVFQGAVSENNIPALLRQYGDKISIHAGLDNGKFDMEDWSKEAIYAELDRLLRETDGGKHLIPGFTMGGVGSTYPGAYEYVDEVIGELSRKYFN